MIPNINIPRVVIIGGGFGGLNLAKSLDKNHFQVVLLDKHNYHTFQPLLYQVSTAGLEPDSIAYPIRKVFSQYKNTYFRVATVNRVESKKNRIDTDIGVLNYDYLVIATGSKTTYFGLENLVKLTMPMKSVTEALDLRSYILQNFEKALVTTDMVEREQLVTYVIAGGGPTGVELAGALAELKKHVLPHDYPDLDFRRMQIHLIEAGPRLLNGMAEISGQKAVKALHKMGVNVWLNTQVKDYDGITVFTDTNKHLQTKTLIWTAGVEGRSIEGLNAEDMVKGNRLKVDGYSKIAGFNNIFAIGDVAAMTDDEYPDGHPMLAPVAIQQARHLAKNLSALEKGKNPTPFKYKDKGTMATIGRNQAVAEMGKLKLSGTLAWLAWMFVHLIMLVGYRNKLVAFVNWTWSYFNYDRGTRLIIRPFKRSGGSGGNISEDGDQKNN